MQKSKASKFGSGALILALGGLVCKIIGALYRVPLTNVLGAEGMGAYQTVFPLFSVLLTISSGGITQTVSIFISASHESGREERGILRASFIHTLILSLCVGIFMFAFAPLLSALQGSPNSAIGYKVLAPVLILSGASSVFKGYFQAKSNVYPTFFSSLIEQIVKLISGLTLSIYFGKFGISYALFGALLGVLISEVISFAYLFLRFSLGKDKPIKTDYHSPNGYDFFRVMRSVIPLTLGGLILPLASLFDSVSVINILTRTLGDNSLATAQYGLLSGTVATLVNLPVVFTISLGVTIVPALSKEKSVDGLSLKGRLSIKLALFICLPLSIVMICLAVPIINFLYPALTRSERALASALLCVESLGITALGITQIYSSLLFSVGASGRASRNLATSAIIKCLLSLPAIYFLGIFGSAISTVICYFTSAFLDFRAWRKLFGEPSYFTRSLSIFLFLATITLFPLFFLAKSLNFPLLCGLCLVCVVLYLYLSLKSKAFTKEELMSLPFGRKIVKPIKKE